MQAATLIALNGFMLGFMWRRFFDPGFRVYNDSDVLRGVAIAMLVGTLTASIAEVV